jgi:hypothetical protein
MLTPIPAPSPSCPSGKARKLKKAGTRDAGPQIQGDDPWGPAGRYLYRGLWLRPARRRAGRPFSSRPGSSGSGFYRGSGTECNSKCVEMRSTSGALPLDICAMGGFLPPVEDLCCGLPPTLFRSRTGDWQQLSRSRQVDPEHPVQATLVSGTPGVRTPLVSGTPGVRNPLVSGTPGVRNPLVSGTPGVSPWC